MHTHIHTHTYTQKDDSYTYYKIHLKSNCQMEKPDSQRSQAGTAGQAGTECTVLKAVETKFQEKHC